MVEIDLQIVVVIGEETQNAGKAHQIQTHAPQGFMDRHTEYLKRGQKFWSFFAKL